MILFLSDSCGPEQLTCKNGQCEDKDYLCDGNSYKKCDDDSDEDEGVCGKCHTARSKINRTVAIFKVK